MSRQCTILCPECTSPNIDLQHSGVVVGLAKCRDCGERFTLEEEIKFERSSGNRSRRHHEDDE